MIKHLSSKIDLALIVGNLPDGYTYKVEWPLGDSLMTLEGDKWELLPGISGRAPSSASFTLHLPDYAQDPLPGL